MPESSVTGPPHHRFGCRELRSARGLRRSRHRQRPRRPVRRGPPGPGWPARRRRRAQRAPGGYAQAFRRGSYLFDPAIHFTMDAGPGGFTPAMLAHLGVSDQVTFVPTEHTCRASFPDLMVEAVPGRQAFLETHQRMFPAEAGGLARLFDMRQTLFAQLAALPQKVGARGLGDAMAAAPLVFRYRMSTLNDVLSEYLTDPRCRAAIGTIWPYVGSPPSRMSFLLFNQMLETLHAGSYYALGSSQTLPDALVPPVNHSAGAALSPPARTAGVT